MRATIGYGRNSIEIEADAIRVASPADLEERDEEAVLKNSLDHPLRSEPLSFFLDDTFLLVVNDAQRPTPTPQVLDVLLERIPHDNFEVVVATGSHPPPTEENLNYIFGRHLPKMKRLHIHRAKENLHTYYGTTSQGVSVSFDSIIDRHTKIVIIGSVEPHYFAGFTGGRKAFLPGLSSYETIEQNHRFAMEREARNLALRGNPVHEGMEEAAHLIPHDVFCINTVLDKKRRVYACSSGDIFKSFYEAVGWSHEVYCIPSQKSDIVVAAAPFPMDISLYQAQKAMENGKLALNDGGILILVAQCWDGIGPDNFYQLLRKSRTPEEALETLKKEYRLGYHKAGKIADLAMRAEIWAVTDLEPRILQNVFMKPYRSVQKAVDDAVRLKGGDVLVFPEASMTVPLCDESCTVEPPCELT